MEANCDYCKLEMYIEGLKRFSDKSDKRWEMKWMKIFTIRKIISPVHWFLSQVHGITNQDHVQEAKRDKISFLRVCHSSLL